MDIMYTVIVENDESIWSDDTGVLYHFPKRYVNLLSPGTNVIYYKGKLTTVSNKCTRETLRLASTHTKSVRLSDD